MFFWVLLLGDDLENFAIPAERFKKNRPHIKEYKK